MIFIGDRSHVPNKISFSPESPQTRPYSRRLPYLAIDCTAGKKQQRLLLWSPVAGFFYHDEARALVWVQP